MTGLMTTGMQAAPMFEAMQANGMPARRLLLARLGTVLQQEYLEHLDTLRREYFDDCMFNPLSPIHTRRLLQRRGLRVTKLTATGELSTAKTSIEHHRYTDDAIALLFKCREIIHCKCSFIDPVLEGLDGDSDYCNVYGQLQTTRTATRRLSGKAPNLLAQPNHSEYGQRLRGCYVAPDGYTFVRGDLSQIEARFLAHESQDPDLCRLFIEDRDIHSETASRLFNLPIDQLDKHKHRVPAKRVVFGTNYGQGGYGLWIQLRMLGLVDWTVAQCESLIRRFYITYPGVARYRDRVIAETRRTGYIDDMWGMRRYLPNIHSEDEKERAEAGRMAVSHRIQGGAQGMLQCSMAYLWPLVLELQSAGVDVQPRLQIHDELIFTVPVGYESIVEALLLDALCNHSGVRLRVPVKADSVVRRTWGGG